VRDDFLRLFSTNASFEKQQKWRGSILAKEKINGKQLQRRYRKEKIAPPARGSDDV